MPKFFSQNCTIILSFLTLLIRQLFLLSCLLFLYSFHFTFSPFYYYKKHSFRFFPLPVTPPLPSLLYYSSWSSPSIYHIFASSSFPPHFFYTSLSSVLVSKFTIPNILRSINFVAFINYHFPTSFFIIFFFISTLPPLTFFYWLQHYLLTPFHNVFPPSITSTLSIPLRLFCMIYLPFISNAVSVSAGAILMNNLGVVFVSLVAAFILVSSVNATPVNRWVSLC